MAQYAIGIDYGTLSVRAILVDIHSGQIAAESSWEYAHGVMEKLPDGKRLPQGFALQHPQDYLDGMRITVKGVMAASGIAPGDVAGIGLDCTAATVLPVYRDKTPLCLTEKFREEPHAYVKMWKHHSAEKEAEEITRLARARREPFLDAYGGKISCEWAVPKLLETLRHAPDVYTQADYYPEVMDWLVWHLTDHLSFSACAMGYKALWHQGRFPPADFFGALDPRMGSILKDKYAPPVMPVGSRAGCLTEKAAAKLGLRPGIPVGTPLIDAHASVPGCGVARPGEMVLIMGTSACHMVLSDDYVSLPGIQGTVRDGILPGYYGIEAGQACVGEHFAWAVNSILPESYAREAREKGIGPHQLLSQKLMAQKAGQSGLLALDWFNGVRTPLMDFDLNGLLIGLNLNTRPEDIYLALVESTAYGTRGIVEAFENARIPVKSIVMAGGIPAKNPLVMKVYANVLGRPVSLSASSQASALGAAVTGIAAAEGGSGAVGRIAERLGGARRGTWQPDPEETRVYDQLYAEYKALEACFGRGGSDVMKRLNRLRRERV